MTYAIVFVIGGLFGFMTAALLSASKNGDNQK